MIPDVHIFSQKVTKLTCELASVGCSEHKPFKMYSIIYVCRLFYCRIFILLKIFNYINILKTTVEFCILLWFCDSCGDPPCDCSTGQRAVKFLDDALLKFTCRSVSRRSCGKPFKLPHVSDIDDIIVWHKSLLQALAQLLLTCAFLPKTFRNMSQSETGRSWICSRGKKTLPRRTLKKQILLLFLIYVYNTYLCL